MADRYMHTLLTPSVLEAQEEYYGRTYPSFEDAPVTDPLRPEEVHMIESRDSFYMATVTEDGWPYLQHRGGPPGFLRALNDRQIGFVDYGGNRQMISVGSVSKEDRVSLFLMDYPSRNRLKILGHAKVLPAKGNEELAARLAPPTGHGAAPERIFLIDILSYDWNCPKFITPRFTEAEVTRAITPLKERIRELEALLAGQQGQAD